MLKPHYDTGKSVVKHSEKHALHKDFLTPLFNSLAFQPHPMIVPFTNFAHLKPFASNTPSKKQWGPLSLVILLHIGFLYALKNSLLPSVHIVQVAPKEVSVTFVSLNATPAVTPTPAKPQHIPVVKKTVTPKVHRQVTPVHHTPSPVHIKTTSTTVSEKAISVPQEAVEPKVQEAPAAASSPSKAAEAPAKNEGPAQPKAVNNSAVDYIRKITPDYPPISQQLGEEGTVTISVTIDAQGHPDKVSVKKTSGFNRLDEAAKSAFHKMLFKPYIENGKPIPVIANVQVPFILESNE